MLEGGSAAVTWIEAINQHPQFRVRRVSPNRERSTPITVAETSGGRYSRVARYRDELLFAWTDGDGPSSRVRTARVSTSWK
jgi:hypothetical protein